MATFDEFNLGHRYIVMNHSLLLLLYVRMYVSMCMGVSE